MNPCGAVVDCQHSFTHLVKIYPFRERPDVGVEVLFYLAQDDAPELGRETVFGMTDWDRLDDFEPPIYGTAFGPKTPFFGVPPVFAGTPAGTAAQWMGDIDHDTWAAGGYPETCGRFILSAYVLDIFDPTGSLTITPNTGHVLANVNDAFAHHWLVGQTFQASNAGDVPLTVQMVASQAAMPFRILNATGQQVVRFRPNLSPGNTPVLDLARDDGTILVTLYDSALSMENGSSGGNFFLTCDQTVSFQGNYFWFRPNRLVSWFGAKLGVGRSFSGSSPTVLPADLVVDMSGYGSDVAIQVTGDLGAGTTEVFQVKGNGNVLAPGISFFGPVGTGQDGTFNCWSYDPAHPAAVLLAAPGQLVEVMRCEDAVAAVLFAVGATGQVQTNQTEIATGPVGTIIARMPIYDELGGLVGYVPIYDAIT